MKPINCLSPVQVRDKLTNKVHLVPCGKCLFCRNKHASEWITRLDLEAKCWPYVVFFTLTYNNNYVPKFLLRSDCSLVDDFSGEYFEPDFFRSLDSVSQKRIRKFRGIRYAPVRDMQLFIKRLRSRFQNICKPTVLDNEKKLQGEDPSLRYYAISEVSPTGYRPHWHGILFFKSKRCFEEIDKIIRSVWRYGIVDSSTVKNSASSYVARYVNSFVSLPKVYQFMPFRPVALFSKRPPIGSLSVLEKTSQEIVSEGIIQLRVSHGNEFYNVPLFSYLKNMLFPKIRGFKGFTHLQRVALYAVYNFAGQAEWSDFEVWFDSVTTQELVKVKNSLAFNLQSFLVFDSFDHDARMRHVKELYRISRRVCLQAKVFNISLSHYVDLIEAYYNKVDYVVLRTYFDFQQSYSVKFGSKSLIFLDPLFCDTYARFDSFTYVPYWMFQVVASFGYEPFDFWYNYKVYLVKYSLEKSAEFRQYFIKVNKIFYSTHKTKARKEWLSSHPECRLI